MQHLALSCSYGSTLWFHFQASFPLTPYAFLECDSKEKLCGILRGGRGLVDIDFDSLLEVPFGI